MEAVTYVLRLEEDKWYVGLTTYLHQRLCQHWLCEGSQWTQLYKPVEVSAVYVGDLERKTTIDLFHKYGTENVKGSAWCNPNWHPNLSDVTLLPKPKAPPKPPKWDSWDDF